MRTYGDRCGIARALDLVGERWALLVVRELLLGPKRFTDLRAGLRRVSPDVLTLRLRELEEAGVVRRVRLSPPAPAWVYELTDRGRELEPVLLALGRWGSVGPVPSEDARLGIDAAVVALRTLFDEVAASGLDAMYELRLGGQSFQARVEEGRLEIERGAAGHPDATIETDPGTLARVLWHGLPLADAERSGALAISGSRPAATTFVGLFPLRQNHPPSDDSGG
jgi:DNA-binding HxlR family transcriptional regulator